MLPNWLYGVARQSASKARASLSKIQRRERNEPELIEPEEKPSAVECDLRDVIDEELGRLPAAYRTPIILCQLEGKAHQEAAEQLGWPVGTLSGRLSRARTMLARRLSRRGVVLSTAALEALSHRQASAESVAAALFRRTLDSVRTCTTAGVRPGTAWAHAATIADGVIRAMLLRKVKTGALLAFCIGAVSVGLIALAGDDPRELHAPVVPRPAERSAQPAERSAKNGSAALLEELDWALTGVDVKNRRLSALARWTWNTMANDEFASSGIRTGLHLSFKDLPVEKDAEILIDGKPGTLRELEVSKETFQTRYGRQMVLKLSEDGSRITRIDARSQNAYFYLQGVDVGRKTITVRAAALRKTKKGDEIPLAKRARILINTEKNGTREGQVTDLKPGMQVSLELGAEEGRIVVLGLRAQE
jgi:hypothetical protein